MHQSTLATRCLPCALLFLTACAPLTQRQLDERAYHRAEYQARYLEYKTHCEASGGKVIVHANRSMRDEDEVGPGDYYHCAMT